MIVALIALFVALGGSSYAAIKIGAGNLKRGAVGSRAIADNSVRSKDVRDGTVAGKDVKDDSLTNADINNQGLEASTADTAGNAASADNANQLDGLDSTAFTRGACSSTNGAIHGYARVIGSGLFPSSAGPLLQAYSPANRPGRIATACARRLATARKVVLRRDGKLGTSEGLSRMPARVCRGTIGRCLGLS